MTGARDTLRACAIALLVLLVGRPSGAQQVAIPRGREDEIAVMLGRGGALPRGCRWAGARIGPSEVRARYDCGAGQTVALLLSLPGRGPADAVRAGAFDVSVDDPTHAELRDAVARRVRGGATGPMAVPVTARPAVRRVGPFEVGRAHAGGDGLVRPPWLDLPLALLVALLLSVALRSRASRADLGWTALAALALLVFARHGRGGVPAHSDVLRDLLFARDCVEGGRCHAMGPESSLTVVRHGTIWLRLPEWVARLGGTHRALRAVVESCHALALVVLALGARRNGAPPTAPLAALAAGVAALWVTDHPMLWHPSIVPLLAALYAVLLLDAVRLRTIAAWTVAGAALGLLLDAHPSSAAMLPCFALSACALAPRPGRTLPLAMLAMLGALALPSPLLLLARVASAAGDRRAVLLLAGVVVATAAGYAARRRVDTLGARTPALLAALPHAVILGLVMLASRRTEARYLGAAIPFAALLLASWAPPRPAAIAALASVIVGLLLGHGRRPAAGARWSIDEARAVFSSPPLRGRSWPDLAARLQWIEGEGIRAVAGLLAPAVRAGDAPGPDVILVARIRAEEVPHHPPPDWTVVRLEGGEVAVARTLRSFFPLRSSRACLDGTCIDFDLGASLSAAPEMPFSPRAYVECRPLDALARRARPGQRLRLALAVVVPGEGRDHRVSVGDRRGWRIDGLAGDATGTLQPDGTIVIDGARPAAGTLLLSAPLGGSAPPPLVPPIVETAADEVSLRAPAVTPPATFSTR